MVSPKQVIRLIGLSLTAGVLGLILLLVGWGQAPAIAFDVAGLVLLAVLGVLVRRWGREGARALHEGMQRYRAAQRHQQVDPKGWSYRLQDPPSSIGLMSARWVLALIGMSLTAGVLGIIFLLVGQGPTIAFDITGLALLALLAMWVLLRGFGIA